MNASVLEQDLPRIQSRHEQLEAAVEVPSSWFSLKRTDGGMIRTLIYTVPVVWNDAPHFLTTFSQVGDADLLALEIDAVKSCCEGWLIDQLEARQTHIAQELHDSLGSQLTGISMLAAAIKSQSQSLGATAELPELAELAFGLERLLAQISKATRWPCFAINLIAACAGFHWAEGRFDA